MDTQPVGRTQVDRSRAAGRKEQSAGRKQPPADHTLQAAGRMRAAGHKQLLDMVLGLVEFGESRQIAESAGHKMLLVGIQWVVHRQQVAQPHTELMQPDIAERTDLGTAEFVGQKIVEETAGWPAERTVPQAVLRIALHQLQRTACTAVLLQAEASPKSKSWEHKIAE